MSDMMVEQHHKQTYAGNVAMVAQQKKNPFREAVTTVSATGEAQSASDLVGYVEAQRGEDNARRNPENPPMNTRRWLVRPKVTESGQYISKAEVFDRAFNPESVYVQTHTKAVMRGIGDIVLGVERDSEGNFVAAEGGILGAAAEGKSPGSPRTPLPSSQYIDAASSGFTLDKLKTANQMLMQGDFGLEDDEMFYQAISPQQITDLIDLADGDGNSLNAFEQQQLRSGRPTQLLNTVWIPTNRLPLDSNGDRLCPRWTKSNIVEGVWQDVKGETWNDTNAKNLPYCYVSAYVDAVRLEDAGVVVIRCAEPS